MDQPSQAITNSARITDDYLIGRRRLASGLYGSVYMGEHKATKEKRVIKVIPNFVTSFSKAFIEKLETLKSIDHPNVAKFCDHYKDRVNTYLVSELCAGEDLFERFMHSPQMDERAVSKLFKEMVEAINCCWEHDIFHKLLKPNNFKFVSTDNDSALKLVDFGFSHFFESQDSESYIKAYNDLSTTYFLAPELLEGGYDKKSAIWSLGVILYILLSGELPFYGENEFVVAERIKAGEYKLKSEVWKDISDECKSLIGQLLVPAEARLTPLEILEHAWFAKMAEPEELPVLSAERLRSFNCIQRVKQVILAHLSLELSATRLRDLQQWFTRADKTGDGLLSVEEIRQALDDCSLKDLGYWIELFDVDNEGVVEYDDFMAAVMWQEAHEFNSRLKEGFQVFDKNGDGKIDLEEMRQVVGEELEEEYVDYWNMLLKEADKNGDGKLDFFEFKKLLYPYTDL